MIILTIMKQTAWLLTALVIPTSIQAYCVADDCYRALFPCETPQAIADAVALCATLSDRYVYASEFPARATGSCGGINKAQYLSACACGPTCTPSSTATTTVTSSSSSTTAQTIERTLPNDLGSGVSRTAITSAMTNAVSVIVDPTLRFTSTETLNSVTGTTLTVTSATTMTTVVSPSESLGTSSNTSLGPDKTVTLTSGTVVTYNATKSQTSSSLISHGGEDTVTVTSVNTATDTISPIVTNTYSLSISSFTNKSSSTTTVVATSLVIKTISSSAESVCDGTYPTSPLTSTNTTLTTVPRTTGISTTVTTTASTSLSSAGYSNTVSPILPTGGNVTATSNWDSDFPTSTSIGTATASTATTLTSTSTATLTSSSAPICTSSSGQDVGFINGDFEDSLPPWRFEAADPFASRYDRVNDGAEGSCTSWQVSLNRTQNNDNDRVGFKLISPIYSVQPGTTYSLECWVKFEYPNHSSMVFEMNDQDTNVMTAIAWRQGTSWSNIHTAYTPSADWIQLTLAYYLGGSRSNTFWVDRIRLSPVPPVSTTSIRTAVSTATETLPPASTVFTLTVLESTPAPLSTTDTTTVGINSTTEVTVIPTVQI
ncbi:hypothetical protein BKA67DRAFT_671106 [Truncatella angustata]|uniref:CBM-cenC domain-containing protein n=1 Tax=Truncatella angustata TaxID=152316 RepID=A0A9P8RKI8_9PEZI|nr:uncharacterized protein BKA67DRAFT_671106 [Truncatella angustata]KAH6643430.1 hypothetical protein BKA67DRAFT_671106 [Truncatella angustata]